MQIQLRPVDLRTSAFGLLNDSPVSFTDLAAHH